MKGRLKKQPALFASITANLSPDSSPVPSPRGRELERGQQAARLAQTATRQQK